MIHRKPYSNIIIANCPRACSWDRHWGQLQVVVHDAQKSTAWTCFDCRSDFIISTNAIPQQIVLEEVLPSWWICFNSLPLTCSRTCTLMYTSNFAVSKINSTILQTRFPFVYGMFQASLNNMGLITWPCLKTRWIGKCFSIDMPWLIAIECYQPFQVGMRHAVGLQHQRMMNAQCDRKLPSNSNLQSKSFQCFVQTCKSHSISPTDDVSWQLIWLDWNHFAEKCLFEGPKGLSLNSCTSTSVKDFTQAARPCTQTTPMEVESWWARRCWIVICLWL